MSWSRQSPWQIKDLQPKNHNPNKLSGNSRFSSSPILTKPKTSDNQKAANPTPPPTLPVSAEPSSTRWFPAESPPIDLTVVQPTVEDGNESVTKKARTEKRQTNKLLLEIADAIIEVAKRYDSNYESLKTELGRLRCKVAELEKTNQTLQWQLLPHVNSSDGRGHGDARTSSSAISHDSKEDWKVLATSASAQQPIPAKNESNLGDGMARLEQQLNDSRKRAEEAEAQVAELTDRLGNVTFQDLSDTAKEEVLTVVRSKVYQEREAEMTKLRNDNMKLLTRLEKGNKSYNRLASGARELESQHRALQRCYNDAQEKVRFVIQPFEDFERSRAVGGALTSDEHGKLHSMMLTLRSYMVEIAQPTGEQE